MTRDFHQARINDLGELVDPSGFVIAAVPSSVVTGTCRS
jgi:hypothetical protein